MATRIDGLISGLDTTTLIQQLMAIESQPLQNLKDQQNKLTWQSNLLSSIKTNVFALQNALTDLTLSSTFTGRLAASSNEGVVTATAQNGAVNTSYTVNVTQVATATTYVSSPLGTQAPYNVGWSSGQALEKTAGGYLSGDYNTQFGTGSSNIGYFYINNVRIDVTATDTINTVLNKITASTAGVKASIVNDGTGDRVVLTQKTVGADKTIDIAAGTGSILTTLHLDTATITKAGIDADEDKPLQNTALFATMGSGYFSINNTFIYVDVTQDTLKSVIAKINSSAAGVIASFDTNTKQITLTSKTVGAGDITFGTYPGTDSIDFVARADLKAVNGPTGTISPTTGGKLVGQDAQVTINGTPVVTKNGTATVNGVTFTIKSQGTAVVTVQNDVDKAVNAVKAFVNAYNTLNDQLQSVLTEMPVKDAQTDADKQKGILFGDAMLFNLSSTIRDMVSATVKGVDPVYMQLSQIGITTGAVGSSVDDAKKGDLVLDEEKLREALASNPDAVAALFGKSNRVYNEEIIANGTATVTVKNIPMSQAFTPIVTVDGVPYTYVTGTLDASKNQFTVDYATGVITFSHNLNAGAKVDVTYDYDTSNAGIALRYKNILAQYTKYGGIFDNRIGTNGSIPAEIKDLGEQIDNFQRLLDMRQQTLYNQFTAMEMALSTLKSQSNWLTAMFGSLSSATSTSASKTGS